MPRDVVALVSADDVVAAVRVHADRVHDLLRRSGCGAEESVEVCESYALALVDALVNAPETVGDMAGWWYGRALALGRRLGAGADEETPTAATSVLAGTSGESEVRAALGALPERERAAVLLRDGYDLPPEAVAVALGTDIDTAAGLVAEGRMKLLARYSGRQVAGLGHHAGRIPADLATLGRVADGSLPMPRSVALRRHLGGCVGCEEAVDAQAKSRRLVTALPIVAMPDDAREAMIERVAERAGAVLPSIDEVLLAVESDHDEGPRLSPILAIVVLTLALVMGVGVAAISTRDTSGSFAPVEQHPSAGRPTPSFSVSPHKHHKRSPSASPTSSAAATQTPTSVATRTSRPSSTPSTSAPPPAAAGISVSPHSGPAGTTITVTGSGWQPRSTVELRYSGTLSSSTSTAVVDRSGHFSGQLTARGTLPGRYTITATNGTQTATASFQQTA